MSTIHRGILQRHLDTWVALAVWVLAILLIVLTGGATGLAVRSTIASATSWTLAPLQWIPRTLSLWPENAQLRAELMQARAELSFLEEAQEENLRLRQMVAFAPPANWILKGAEVHARYKRVGNRRIVVGIGSNSGILPPMPVLTPNGLVGRVLSVKLGSAEIQVIGDPQMGVAVRNQRTRVEGILRTSREGTMSIEGVPLTADVKARDIWVTAGVGAIYPRGIPVAQQLPIPPPSSHFQVLPVKTAQDIDAVESVFILTNYEQAGKAGDVDQ